MRDHLPLPDTLRRRDEFWHGVSPRDLAALCHDDGLWMDQAALAMLRGMSKQQISRTANEVRRRAGINDISTAGFQNG